MEKEKKEEEKKEISIYHFSYDTIDSKENFDTYQQAKDYLLCVLFEIPGIKIEGYCESTLVLFIPRNEHQRLFDFLKKNLNKYFHYLITLIAVVNGKHCASHNRNKKLAVKLKYSIENELSCSILNKYDIIDY